MYTIKHFKDLTVSEFYEIAKARYIREILSINR